MREIEVKFEIENIEAVKHKIESIGARYEGLYPQLDIWFDTREEILKRKGCGLRLRLQGEEATLTLKEKLVVGKLVREAEEHEVGVDDFDKTKEILEKLGFQEKLSYQKEREEWVIENVSIILDRVENLGVFLELEGAKEDIEEVIKKLGLEKAQRITEHYGQIYEKRIG